MSRAKFVVLPLVIFLFLVLIAYPSMALSTQFKYIHVSGRYEWTRGAVANIVVDGGFESIIIGDTSVWRVISSDSIHSGTITRSNDAFSGSYSGLFTVTSNPINGGYVALSESTFYWAIGQTYTLTFYYKSTLSNCNAFVFCKSEQTTTGFDIAYWQSNNMPPTNAWTKMELTFGPIPQGTVDLQIHFNSAEGVVGTLQLDEISTKLGSISPSVTPTPNPTSTPTTTPAPTNTPNPTPIPTPTPITTLNPTVNPTPTLTQDPLSTLSPTNSPTPTPVPPIPEFSSIIVAFAVIVATGLALFSRKKVRTRAVKHGLLSIAAVMVATLLLSLMINVGQGQSVTSTPLPNPELSFSLWFTNGTTFPTDGRNADGLVVYGGMYLNVGGIHCIPSGYGSSAAKLTNIIVLRNDGNVPLRVSLALKNVVSPSNIQILMVFYPMSPQTYAPYSNNWMGNGNVTTENSVDPGEYFWIGLTVYLAQPNVPMTGTPNYSFDYSFDIQVTATPA